MKKKLKQIISAILVAIMLIGTAPISGINLSVESSAMDLSSYKVGDLIEFGSYPQSEVKDEALIAELDDMTKDWQSYGYYSGTGKSIRIEGFLVPMRIDDVEQSDYMKFAEIFYKGNRYRAVYFSKYRPSYSYSPPTENMSAQDDDGYYINQIYYFKYEPLTWRVLDPDEGYVMCNNVIDAQIFQIYEYLNLASNGNDNNLYNSKDYKDYCSDWKTSSIREWLNNDFYNTAFSQYEKGQIGKSYLENKCFNTSEYDGAPTYDKIFVMSYFDVKNSKYGFNSDEHANDPARRLKSTDYAKCQGCGRTRRYDGDDESIDEYSGWMLRSPGFSFGISWVSPNGWSDTRYGADADALYGISPAFKFNPKTSHTHTLNHITVPSTCKVAGMEYDICTECGETLNEKTLPLAAHKWSDWTVVKQPTATEEGIEKRTCSVCGDSETRSIEKFSGIRDSETGVEIIYNDEYTDGTELKVEEKFSGKSFQLIDTAYGKTNTAIYDISTYKDGVKVQPNGEVTVRVPLPKGFSANKVFVCYVDSTNGKVTKIPCEVKDGYVIFMTNHFSEYAVVEQLACVKSVSVSDVTLNYKKSATIKPTIKADKGAKYTVKYSSSNTKVATVGEDGKIYGAKKGNATITCTVTDSYGNVVKDSCNVNVEYSTGQWLIIILLFGWIWYI